MKKMVAELVAVAKELMASGMDSRFTLGRGSNTNLCAKITVSSVPPKADVFVTSNANAQKWVGRVVPIFVGSISRSMMAAGEFDGVVEIGVVSEHAAWSDDYYVAIWSDNKRLADKMLDVVKKTVPLGGGGVSGSSYKGTGIVEKGTNQYTYHFDSFGIGD